MRRFGLTNELCQNDSEYLVLSFSHIAPLFWYGTQLKVY